MFRQRRRTDKRPLMTVSGPISNRSALSTCRFCNTAYVKEKEERSERSRRDRSPDRRRKRYNAATECLALCYDIHVCTYTEWCVVLFQGLGHAVETVIVTAEDGAVRVTGSVGGVERETGSEGDTGTEAVTEAMTEAMTGAEGGAEVTEGATGGEGEAIAWNEKCKDPRDLHFLGGHSNIHVRVGPP